MLAQACSARDARGLYPAIEERARLALRDIVSARSAARALIQETYPLDERADALAQLGDGARAQAGAELLALRCGADCLSALCRGVGAPASSQLDGGALRVKTVRGGDYLLSRSADGRYGLAFNADALTRESARAFAELSVIKRNAKIYQQQKALQ